MSWARIDDGFHDHPKVDELDLAAVGLWTLCLTWAHRHRRTAILAGHLTEARVRKVAGKQGDALAEQLVKAGLWDLEPNIGGWVIHDFEDYLPKQRDPSERREAGRKGAAKRWETDSKLPSNGMASDSSRASAPASPSRPVPSQPNDVPDGTSSGPRKRGSRIDPDWKPTPELVAWQRENHIPDDLARRELPKFIDYWTGMPGQKGVRLDWGGTWRNWLRRTEEREPRTARPSGMTSADIAARMADPLWAGRQ